MPNDETILVDPDDVMPAENLEGGVNGDLIPQTRLENFLAMIAGIPCDQHMVPKTRLEWFLCKIAVSLNSVADSHTGDDGPNTVGK